MKLRLLAFLNLNTTVPCVGRTPLRILKHVPMDPQHATPEFVEQYNTIGYSFGECIIVSSHCVYQLFMFSCVVTSCMFNVDIMGHHHKFWEWSMLQTSCWRTSTHKVRTSPSISIFGGVLLRNQLKSLKSVWKFTASLIRGSHGCMSLLDIFQSCSLGIILV